MADGLYFSWKALAFDKLSDRLVFGVWMRSLRSRRKGKTFQKEDFDRNHMWWKSNFMQMTYENLRTRHPTVASKVLTFLYLFLMDIMQNIISLSFFRSFKLFSSLQLSIKTWQRSTTRKIFMLCTKSYN